MQEVEESFAYTTFFALKIRLMFENKNYIPITKCFGVRRVLEEEARLGNITFKKIDEVDALNQFLREYQGIVYIKNDYLYLNNKVKIDDINEIISSLKVGYYLDYNLKTFQYLGITEPIKIIYGLYAFEKNLEKLYITPIDNKPIELKLMQIEQIFQSFKSKNEEYIDILYDIQQDILDQGNDPYIIFPISKTLYENSAYYDEEWDIEEKFYDPVQVAIFSNIALYPYKIQFRLEKLYDLIEKQKDDNEEVLLDDTIDSEYGEDDYQDVVDTILKEPNINKNLESFGQCEDLSTKETVFALQYLLEISRFQEKYGFNDSLEKISNRIKYIIDNEDLCLIDDKTELEFLLNQYLENDDFDYYWYKDESYYFVYELFNIYPDEYFLKKLLFVKSYYALTNDPELLEEISMYKNYPNYNDIYNIIIGDEKNKTKHI